LTECSHISDISNAFPGAGGIYTEEQTEGWKKIVDSVHAKGAKIFIQVFHCGRAAISATLGGKTPIAPSPIKITVPHSSGADHPEP
jgi:2,4-dienoyl-CoA reductase-like NADH-dependent reductase (Old Yellow Enzyme family)